MQFCRPFHTACSLPLEAGRPHATTDANSPLFFQGSRTLAGRTPHAGCPTVEGSAAVAVVTHSLSSTTRHTSHSGGLHKSMVQQGWHHVAAPALVTSSPSAGHTAVVCTNLQTAQPVQHHRNHDFCQLQTQPAHGKLCRTHLMLMHQRAGSSASPAQSHDICQI